MTRPPVIPDEKKTRIVLSVLAGEVSIGGGCSAGEGVGGVDREVEG